jgi:predicted O-methyltransferase YrrM
LIKNILINALNKNYFLTIVKKLVKRFEKDSSTEAKIWAKQNVKQSTEEFCRSIDTPLYDKISLEINEIRKEAKEKLSKLDVSLGGGGNYALLFFLIQKFNLINVVETGVAAGWTSLAILRAFKKNKKGFLYSSDFPYFRLKNPAQYIGYLAHNEENRENWYLDIRGDDVALPKIIHRMKDDTIDLIHYDSDKTYSGRSNAMKTLNKKINSNTIIIFDDIQDNLHFRDFVKNKENFYVLEFEKKYIGIVDNNLFSKFTK